MKSVSEFTQQFAKEGQATYSYSVLNGSASKTAVIMHGISGAKEDMEGVGKLVAKKGYAVYLIDLPNHGQSSRVKIKGFDQLAQWLADAMKAIGIVPDVLIGNSYASAICYNYAYQGYLPDKTQLILACPTPTVALPSFLLGKALLAMPKRAIAPFYHSRPLISARVTYLAKVPGEPRRQLRASELRKIPYLEVIEATNMANLVRPDSPFKKYRLPEAIQRRTTVLIGDRDNVVTSKSVGILRDLLPYASFEIIRGVGHILHFEAPTNIANSVK